MPWRTSDLGDMDCFPLDIAKEGSGAPLECPYERRRRVRKVPFHFGTEGVYPGCFTKSVEVVENAVVSGALFLRVWNVLKGKALRRGVIRKASDLMESVFFHARRIELGQSGGASYADRRRDCKRKRRHFRGALA